MNRFALNFAVAVLAPIALLHPTSASCQTAPAEERLAHISVTTMGSSGSAVMLIPGLASPRAVWDGVASELAKTHRVYLVQVNGFGGDAPGENVKPGVLDGIAADLNSYIAKHKIEKPAIIGHSMGGLLAMMMGARYPAATGSVMVVDALPFFSLIYGPTATVDAARPFAEQARAQTIATPQPTAPVTADPGGIWSIKAEGRIKVANWGAKAAPAVTGQALYEVMTTDLRPELAKITAKPFTVLYATGAGPQPKVIWEGGYAGSPAKLVPIADSWHFIMLDQPTAFADALKEFLAGR
ncbi:MAG: alpha/beta hydrolase [Sphingomonas sp.]|uniref:alpha/beta fold hydrolase n=1 Tax=Sphingomonas sp. TaxID=28214 RepID=UPI0025EBF330|nr:alpha/beta hydrolase [Sphingomonas sp.]MBY0282945.1 alpha/beta hydrolase [Sphingomonas sp.]